MKIRKEIPQDILKKIYAAENNEGYSRSVRYYPYFEIQHKKLAVSVVAVRQSRKKTKGKLHRCIYVKKVTVHIVGEEFCYFRDIDYYFLGGYVVSFNKEKKFDTERKRTVVNQYEDEQWYSVEKKYFRIYNCERQFLNIEFLKSLPEFKYCGFDFSTSDIVKYLENYKKFPQMEMISKLISSHYANSSRIRNLAIKDKDFVIWLRKNAAEIKSKAPNVQSVINAYKNKSSIDYESDRIHIIRSLNLQCPNVVRLKQQMPKERRQRLYSYLARNKINLSSYEDYIHAIMELSVLGKEVIDMDDTKNLFPINFKMWHDIRIAQYAEMRGRIDQEYENRRRKKLEEEEKIMRSVAEKYKQLLCLPKDENKYIVLIAKSIDDLKREGKILHHCVGKMDYDKRIIEERSLIFFIRVADMPQTPFVTVEFSIQKEKVLQCYTDHDKRPDQEVEHFVYDEWQPLAIKALKKIKRQQAA